MELKSHLKDGHSFSTVGEAFEYAVSTGGTGAVAGLSPKISFGPGGPGDKHQELSDQQIDAALEGTGFSSKTKALRAYAREGYDHRAISVALDATIKANIPIESRASFALYLANSKMNGSVVRSYRNYRKLCGGRLAWGMAGFYVALYGDSRGMRHVFGTVKQSTLARWSSALVLIDEAFQ